MALNFSSSIKKDVDYIMFFFYINVWWLSKLSIKKQVFDFILWLFFEGHRKTSN